MLNVLAIYEYFSVGTLVKLTRRICIGDYIWVVELGVDLAWSHRHPLRDIVVILITAALNNIHLMYSAIQYSTGRKNVMLIRW